MGDKGHLIKSVDPGSIADELGLEPGDRLLTVNGNEVEDIFDYEYFVCSPRMLIVIEKKDGELWELDIENEYEDLGITFENGLMSDYRSCSNQCIFCFIDQMPPGMRKTLYFKDDDSRLSFLQGNYITLTNMKEHDIQRIIEYRLAPINISVHTTNPGLRRRMLNNRFAGEALTKIDLLYKAGIPMNGQIVLCRGINDGEELNRTIRDLSAYLPHMGSVSAVPVGLTKYREGLYPLKPFDGPSAGAAIDIIESWQKRLYAEHGNHFIHASDELYLLAGRELPEEGRYDGYPQLENGVGMLRLLDTEVTTALEGLPKGAGRPKTRKVSLATGLLAYAPMERQVGKITARFPWAEVRLYGIRNDFFGEGVTVSGLITGCDLIRQLAGKDLGCRLLLPCSMFRSGEEVFLDDVTRSEVEAALHVPVEIVGPGGQDLVDAVLSPVGKRAVAGEKTKAAAYEGYELKEITKYE